MGFIWNIMLSFSDEELCWDDDEDEPPEPRKYEPLERINAWIESEGSGRLVELIGPTYDDNAGYGMDANLYGGGFKHFDIEGFIKVVECQNWKDRGAVQLWVKGAEEGTGEDPFVLIKLRRRKLARHKPELADWSKPAKKKSKKKASKKAVKLWTKGQLNTLKKEYPKADTQKLAKKLKRTIEAVRFQAKIYGLKKT